ncbi:Beta-xylosidase [compost metagenome]
MTAEGGTRYGHAITMARSATLLGTYEADPNGPLLTSADRPEAALQRAGHGSLVETQQGELYVVHLCGRPLRPSMCCTLGRETAIQKVEWTEDGWLRLTTGDHEPQVRVAGPSLPEHPFAPEPETEHFDGVEISRHFSTLREPLAEEWATLKERPGYLRLKGRESLYSHHRQSLVARRQQSFLAEAETVVEFAPETYQQLAGLIYYYNTKNYYYLWISWDEELGKCLGIMSSDRGVYDEPLESPISIEGWERCYMKAVIRREVLRFYYSRDGVEWLPIGGEMDATKLSDENAELVKDGIALDQGFTGAFIGICAQDLSGRQLHADFDYFTYRELDE